MCVHFFPEHLTVNLAILSSSYDVPSHGGNVPFQSNYSGMPKDYHHTAGSIEDPFTEHALFRRRGVPDLDYDFIGSEAFYEDLTGMGLSSSTLSKHIIPPQSTNNQISCRDLKLPGGLEDAHKSGKPISIIASPAYLFDSIRLPSEYAYNFLGLFFLVDIHVSPLGIQHSRSITDLDFSGKRSGLPFR